MKNILELNGKNNIKRSQKETSVTRNQYAKHSGFTLVEMIVTMVVLAIALGLTTMGILAWQDWAQFKQENEYAQSIFVAAQNQLNEYQADGRLEKMHLDMIHSTDFGGAEKENIVNHILDVENATNSKGEAYDLDSIWPESINSSAKAAHKELYRDDIICLQADAKNGDFEKYLENASKLKNDNPSAFWAYELISSYIYDPSILSEATISLEITPEDGQVFAVLYTDKNGSLEYRGKDDTNNTESIPNASYREEGYRQNYMVGFCDVETLTASTHSSKIAVKNVHLKNEETLYLSFDLGKNSSLLQAMDTYKIDVVDKSGSETNGKTLLSIELDGVSNAETGVLGIENKESALARISDASKPQKTATVTRYEYEESGTNEEKLNAVPIVCWIQNNKIFVTLDAADIQATSFEYLEDYNVIMDYTDTTLTKFQKTYSFFRFGVIPREIGCTVVAYSDSISAAPESNPASENTSPVFASQSDGKNKVDFGISNPRHLYNVRYMTSLSYEQQLGDKSNTVTSVNFNQNKDLDWGKFQEDGYLYNSYVSSQIVDTRKAADCIGVLDGSGSFSADARFVCDFPSIPLLRTKDTYTAKKVIRLIGNDNYQISNLHISQKANALYLAYTKKKADNTFESTKMKPCGLFIYNYGNLEHLILDDHNVMGNRFTGGFVGINAGNVDDLLLANSNDRSIVQGNYNVGGIIGYDIPVIKTTKAAAEEYDIEIKNLENHAKVSGHQAVGGILGMIRNDYNFKGKNATIEPTELTGLDDATKNKLVNNQTTFSAQVSSCENYGPIIAINAEDMVDEDATSTAPTQSGSDDRSLQEIFEHDAKYLGGIVGYCYNADTTHDPDKILIKDCISAPEYKNNPLDTIAKNKTGKTSAQLRQELNAQLKGVYVGGVVGYNYFGTIENSNATTKDGSDGYVFGYQYVGGIVGMNIGPASGIRGGDKSGKRGLNQNHVVGYKYVGGVTGSNANIANKTEDQIAIEEKDYDPETATVILNVSPERSLNVELSDWQNEGVVIALKQYGGGITGYNSGRIYNCMSAIDSTEVDSIFADFYSGDYIGGIAGYNNGILGNTKRTVDANDFSKSTVDADNVAADKRVLPITCYMTGKNYVGGIVGYNDINAVVEDYEVAGGYVLGDEGSCFVGGYAGLNASIDLLMNLGDESDASDDVARKVYSNPNKVMGTYCVGGNVGGNIVNTRYYAQKDIPTPSDEDGPIDPTKPDKQNATDPRDWDVIQVNDRSLYAYFEYSGNINNIQVNDNYNNRYIDKKIIYDVTLVVVNNTDQDISNWKVLLNKQWNKGEELPNNKLYATRDFDIDHMYDYNKTYYDEKNKEITYSKRDGSIIKSHKTAKFPLEIYDDETDLIDFVNTYIKNNQTQFQVSYFDEENNKYGNEWAYIPLDNIYKVNKNTKQSDGDDNWGYKQYMYSIYNYDEKSLINWRLELEFDKNIEYKSLSVQGDVTYGVDNGTLWIIGNSSIANISNKETNNYCQQDLYIDLKFNNINDVNAFDFSKARLYSNNVLVAGEPKNALSPDNKAASAPKASRPNQDSLEEEGDGFDIINPEAAPVGNDPDGTNPDGTNPSDEEERIIYTCFKTDNFLGSLEGEEFVGGFVGYNMLFYAPGDDEKYNAANIASEILNNFKTINSDSTLAANKTQEQAKSAYLQRKIEFLNDLETKLKLDSKASKCTMLISGENDELTTQSKLGNIKAQVYVGGVIGYNDFHTKLKIKNIINNTPVKALAAVNMPKEQMVNDVERLDYKGEPFTYSYAGGIAGRVNSSMSVYACKNSSGANVTSVGTYTGGIAEVNAGIISGCQVTNMGASNKDYIGGICGINKAKETKDGSAAIVSNCLIEDQTITGRNYVGGFVAENFGQISNCGLTNANIRASFVVAPIIVEGSQYEENQGIAGGICAYNEGQIIFKNEQDEKGTDITQSDFDINISSNGNYVGGLIGLNKGLVNNLLDTKHVKVKGNVYGVKYVGGIIGENIVSSTSGTMEVKCFDNEASVTATAGEAGGIIGANSDAIIISNCINEGIVKATKTGNAGGITAENTGHIRDCKNHASVSAPNGMTGGITALNGAMYENEGASLRKVPTAKIENCIVEPKSNTEDDRLTFTSLDKVGGICADNYAKIENVKLKNVDVYNYTSSKVSDIGVVCGVNELNAIVTLGIGNDIIDSCSAKSYTNHSNIGGVAGKNNGTISGASLKKNEMNLDIPQSIIDGIIIGYKSSYASYGNMGGIAGLNVGSISKLSVKGATIEGDLNSENSGYGGIVGYNGYSFTDLRDEAEQNSEAFAYDEISIAKEIAENNQYTAIIEHCTFNGKIHAQGSGISAARLGGIAGKNAYKAKITLCQVGVADYGDTQILAGHTEYGSEKEGLAAPLNRITKIADRVSYAYIGGVTGENYGLVSKCDNASYSGNTHVKVEHFAGNSGGIVGYCRRFGRIEGASDCYTSTGEKWTVRMRGLDNDTGCGGICGRYSSGQDVSYMRNYAMVDNSVEGNSNSGGILGYVAQIDKNRITVSNCVNYGYIFGHTRVGGIISQFKNKAGCVVDCINYGTVVSLATGEHFMGGIVGRMSDINTDGLLKKCVNHGYLYALAGDPTSYQGGIIGGFLANSDNSILVIDSCVNTGEIRKLTVNSSGVASYSVTSNAGGICGSKGSPYFVNCRNYGTGNMNGISASYSMLTDCYTTGFNSSTGNAKPFSSLLKSDLLARNYSFSSISDGVGRYQFVSKLNDQNKYDIFIKNSVEKSFTMKQIPDFKNNGYVEAISGRRTDSRLTLVPSSTYKPEYDEDDFEINATMNPKDAVYLEFDPLYEAYIYNGEADQTPLPAPTGLSLSPVNGLYQFSWIFNEIQHNAKYEVYYELVGKTDSTHIISHKNDSEIIGSVQKYVLYDVDTIEEEWNKQYEGEDFKIVCYVRAISNYHLTHSSLPDFEKYDSEFVSIEYNGIKRLPLPEYHLELIDGNAFVAILDNVEDYSSYQPYVKNITVSDFGSCFYYLDKPTSKVSSVTIDSTTGYSKPFKIDRNKNDNDGDLTRIAQALSTNSNVFADSTKRLSFGLIYDNRNIESDSDHNLLAEFKGFYGDNPTSMSYHLKWTVTYRDTYIAADLTSYDDALGVDVAYAYGISHVSMRINKNPVDFEATLTGFPVNVIGKEVTARTYLYCAQEYDLYYGHYVSKKVRLESHSDLESIVDAKYFNASGVKTPQNILDENGKLRPGYVLFHNGDGTYDIYFNATLELEQKSRPANPTKYKNYQVRYTTYSMGQDKDTDGYDLYNINKLEKSPDGLKSAGTQRLQPKPEISSEIVETTEEGSVYSTYQFKWDEDKTGDQYNNAKYAYEIYGVALDGSKVSLQTVVETSDRSCEITQDASWNYKSLVLEVVRLGTVNSGQSNDASSPSIILPRISEPAEFVVKLRLSQIAAPDVSLTVDEETGNYIKDGYDYFVSWGPITDNLQLADLGGYIITARSLKTEDNPNPSNTHYYYVRTDKNNVPPAIQRLMDASTITHETVTEINDVKSLPTGDMRATIDFSDFNQGETLEISVKAVAKKDSSIYKDGPLGVVTYLTLPSRLETPRIETMTSNLEYDASDAVAQSQLNQGMLLRLADSQFDMSGHFELAVALFDDETKELIDSNPDEIHKPGAKGKVLNASDASSVTAPDYWNSQAISTLIGKKAQQRMNGDFFNGEQTSYRVVPSIGNLSDYAGDWLKVAVRATATNAISSSWSDEDTEDATVNYKWIRIPKALLENTNMKQVDSLQQYYTGNEFTLEQMANSLPVGQLTFQFDDVKYADGYKIQLVNTPEIVDGVQITNVGYLYIQKDATNTGYNVYYDGSNLDKTNANHIAKDNEICKENVNAIFIGNTSQELMYLPYAMNTTLDGTIKDANGQELSAYLVYKDWKFTIVLPDITSINGSSFIQNTTQSMLLSTIVNEENQVAYVPAEANLYTCNASQINNIDLSSASWNEPNVTLNSVAYDDNADNFVIPMSQQADENVLACVEVSKVIPMPDENNNLVPQEVVVYSKLIPIGYSKDEQNQKQYKLVLNGEEWTEYFGDEDTSIQVKFCSRLDNYGSGSFGDKVEFFNKATLKNVVDTRLKAMEDKKPPVSANNL